MLKRTAWSRRVGGCSRQLRGHVVREREEEKEAAPNPLGAPDLPTFTLQEEKEAQAYASRDDAWGRLEGSAPGSEGEEGSPAGSPVQRGGGALAALQRELTELRIENANM